MRVSRVLGVALLTLRVTETAKEALPVIPPPPVKSAFTMVVAATASVLLGERDARVVLVEAGAAAGLASLFHDVQDMARRYQDLKIAQMLQIMPKDGVVRRSGARATALGVQG